MSGSPYSLSARSYAAMYSDKSLIMKNEGKEIAFRSLALGSAFAHEQRELFQIDPLDKNRRGTSLDTWRPP